MAYVSIPLQCQTMEKRIFHGELTSSLCRNHFWYIIVYFDSLACTFVNLYVRNRLKYKSSINNGAFVKAMTSFCHARPVNQATASGAVYTIEHNRATVTWHKLKAS